MRTNGAAMEKACYVSMLGALRSERVIGHIIWPSLQTRRVIRRMYNICLLTTVILLCDISVTSDGSGAGGRSSQQSKLAGRETPKRPAPLWTVTYRLGPSFRGL